MQYLDESEYYSFDEAVEIMKSGQVMGGGDEFDYYFMIKGVVYGGASCDPNHYEIDTEAEKEESFYVISDMDNLSYAKWIEEGYSEFVPREEQ